MNKYPLISVIILNWNRLEDTKRSIDSVLSQTYPHFEVIVIDNHSDEEGFNTLPQIYPDVRFYQMDKNYGCPGGRNIGIEYVQGEYVFFVDNDGVLESHALENAFRIFQEHEHVGIVTGRIIFYDAKSTPVFQIDPNEKEKPSVYTHTFSGGISMHKRSIYDKIGKYNDDFMYGGEETNLALRLQTINQYVYYADNVVLWHKRSELARPRQFNFISACSNMYFTYKQLMPWEFRCLFIMYFTLRYPLFALKNGYFFPFLNAMPKIYKRKSSGLMNKELRLSRKELYLFQALSKKKIKNEEELKIKKNDYNYWNYLKAVVSFKL